MRGNWALFILAWLLAVAAVVEADAQTGSYPNKPVQIITDSSAGSTPDVALRIVADGPTKQQVLVNNHPGAGGSLAVRPCRIVLNLTERGERGGRYKGIDGSRKLLRCGNSSGFVSALGQQRTTTDLRVAWSRMSALPPKADIRVLSP